MTRALARAAAVALMALSALATAAGSDLDARLRTLSGEVGIWYFYLSTCPYCMRQEPILTAIAERYGIPVTAISLDGGPPPGGEIQGYVYDRGQATRLGVQVTPTLYLVHPASQQTAMLSAGHVDASTLLLRIAWVAEQAGWQPAPGRRQPPEPTVTANEILNRVTAEGGWR